MMTSASATRARSSGLLARVVGPGGVSRLMALLRQLGPYAAIELLLPGGSLIALALWLYRRQQRRVNGSDGIAVRPCQPDPPDLACAGARAASMLASPC